MGRQTFVPGNGLVLGALDSQSLGPGSMLGMDFSFFLLLYLKYLFIHQQVPMSYILYTFLLYIREDPVSSMYSYRYIAVE